MVEVASFPGSGVPHTRASFPGSAVPPHESLVSRLWYYMRYVGGKGRGEEKELGEGVGVGGESGNRRRKE